jgi:hemerythrin-like metal-binding protein
MSTIHWSDDLLVNIQEIDLQHRQLFNLFGELEKAVALGAGRQSLDRVIRELNVYVREHFTTEERWMHRHEFPFLPEHLAQHETFVDKLLNLELDHLGGRVDISQELLDYLENWLKDHIGGYDMAFAKYFRNIDA